MHAGEDAEEESSGCFFFKDRRSGGDCQSSWLRFDPDSDGYALQQVRAWFD